MCVAFHVTVLHVFEIISKQSYCSVHNKTKVWLWLSDAKSEIETVHSSISIRWFQGKLLGYEKISKCIQMKRLLLIIYVFGGKWVFKIKSNRGYNWINPIGSLHMHVPVHK